MRRIGVTISISQYYSMPLGKENQPVNMLHAFKKEVFTSKCGVDKKVFTLKSEFGSGEVIVYKFEGVVLSIYDIKLKKALEYQIDEKELVLFSFLLQGEQVFQLDQNKKVIAYEGNETYWIRAQNLKGHARFLPNYHWREVRISISEHFINRHQLGAINRFSVLTSLGQIKPRVMSSKELLVLFEILEDKKENFLKRLFLEAKILELFSQSITADQTQTTKYEPTSKTILQAALEVNEILKSNIDKSYSIPELARMVGINESSLQKQFKKVFKKTIFDYALEVKMNKAKALLVNSDKQIYEISNAIGYKNPTHFTAAFKRLYQTTPKNYRSQKYQSGRLAG